MAALDELPSSTRDSVLLSIDEVVNEQDKNNSLPEETSTTETLPETTTNAQTFRPPREKRPTDNNNKTEVRLKALEKEVKELSTLLKLAGVHQLKTSLTQQPAKTNPPRSRGPRKQRE